MPLKIKFTKPMFFSALVFELEGLLENNTLWRGMDYGE